MKTSASGLRSHCQWQLQQRLAGVLGNSVLPKARQACWDDAMAEHGQAASLARRWVPLQWASEGGDLLRQKDLVTRHIPIVPGKYNKARDLWLCMHTGTFLFCIWCYGSCPTDSLPRISLKNSQDWSTRVELVATKKHSFYFFIKVITPNKCYTAGWSFIKK